MFEGFHRFGNFSEPARDSLLPSRDRHGSFYFIRYFYSIKPNNI